MGYEVKFIYHPRKEEGGFDYETKEEKIVKVGKPFDDTPYEALAASIMAMMARRDIWVIDVVPFELVKKEVSFKECKDGKGIILKNKRFSFNAAAQMVAEDASEEAVHHPLVNGSGGNLVVVQHPHEMVVPNKNIQHPHEAEQNLDDLYSNPSRPVPVKKMPIQVNQNRVLYHVIFEPYIYEAEVKRRGMRFTPDKKYPVHQVKPSPTGKLDAQKLMVTDDTGRVVEVDEKYFTNAGMGLSMDAELGFSNSPGNGRSVRGPKLAYEDEMYVEVPDVHTTQNGNRQPPRKGPRQAQRNIPHDIPIDDGSVPPELMAVPDLRD